MGIGSSVIKDTEMTVSSGTTSVHDIFLDMLMVELANLLHGDLILEKSRTGAGGSVRRGVGRGIWRKRCVY